ncbi:MAG: hypothetical protein A2033_11955 [Bacteroidetes bacterium GWA2_31_9]|nr:MAG: hypothetical protein A2033_11955 [Bacteroidetes bacterium GWA2_31_9]
MKNIISKRTLIENPNYINAKKHIETWLSEVKTANWHNHNELKEQFGSASIINQHRVVFNIKGNKYRLVVDIEYKIQFVYIIWFGSHKEYDKLEVSELTYS